MPFKGTPMGEKTANKRKNKEVGQRLLLRKAARAAPTKKTFLHIIPFMFQRLYRQSKGADFHSPLT